MKFQESFDFDHDVATIMRMFSDKSYYLRKYERLGGRKPELIDCDSDGERFTITVRHALDASKLSFPDLIKKRIGDRLMLSQTDVWQLPKRSGRIDIDIERAPVSVVIDMDLVAHDSKSRLELNFNIEADVPLLGGKIEKAIAGPITKRMHKDLELSREMAADYAG